MTVDLIAYVVIAFMLSMVLFTWAKKQPSLAKVPSYFIRYTTMVAAVFWTSLIFFFIGIISIPTKYIWLLAVGYVILTIINAQIISRFKSKDVRSHKTLLKEVEDELGL